MEHTGRLIPEPTYCRLKHVPTHELTAHIRNLKKAMKVFSNVIVQWDKLKSEAQLLNIMIYKRKQQLRREKSLQLLKRVQACLKRADCLERLFSLAADLDKELLASMSEMTEKKKVYLPARQTWSFFLYIMEQFVKLLEQTRSYCETTFQHLSCQLSTGILIPQMIIFMGIVARVWMLSGSLVEKVDSCYSPAYTARQHITPTHSDWTEPKLSPHLQLAGRQNSSVQIDMYQTAKETSLNPTTTESELNPATADNTEELSLCIQEDLGEPILRRDFTDASRRQGDKVKKKKKKRRQTDNKVLDEIVCNPAEEIEDELHKNKKRKLEKVDMLQDVVHKKKHKKKRSKKQKL